MCVEVSSLQPENQETTYDGTRTVTLKTTRSGKGVMVVDESGNVFMTSVFMLKKLLEELNPQKPLYCNRIGSTDPDRFKPKEGGFKFKVTVPEEAGDPLAVKVRKDYFDSNIKVSDEW